MKNKWLKKKLALCLCIETIKKRLDVYHNQTSPLIDWYEREGIRNHIDGLGDLDRIFGDICAVIDAL